MNYIVEVVEYIIESFLHAWPYLLLTIPVSVAVKMSGASKYINKALTARPVISVFLSTFVGAFSPLCSCTVIPVIASLLIGGVPLAPVMSFWLASPSMDPEIFFLTVSSLGWDLAVWRLLSTLVLSLGGGLLTMVFSNRGWLGDNPIRNGGSMKVEGFDFSLEKTFKKISQGFRSGLGILIKKDAHSSDVKDLGSDRETEFVGACDSSGCCADQCAEDSCGTGTEQGTLLLKDPTFWRRLLFEIKDATIMVAKFMLLAWFLGAIIRLYIPESWINKALGNNNPFSIIVAALLGIPAYTSSLAAMPLVGGLLDQGMHPAAALAFLIAGPTTTLPAMSAVWGLVNRKVFALYVGFSLFGAILFAYFYSLFY